MGEGSSTDARLPGGSRRRLLALKDGRSGGLGDTGGAAARLCALQCLQHACISWHKIYMGGSEEASSSEQPREAVPTAATECLAQCGAPADDASCLALVRRGARLAVALAFAVLFRAGWCRMTASWGPARPLARCRGSNAARPGPVQMAL